MAWQGTARQIYCEEAQMKERLEEVTVQPANLLTVDFEIEGEAPYVSSAISERMKAELREKHAKGSQAKKEKGNRSPKDFEALYQEAIHYSKEGWAGIPAMAFKKALVSACRLINFTMTRGKISLFVIPQGFDRVTGIPLIKITKGKPRPVEHVVTISTTVDLRVRAMWDEGWRAHLAITFDADQFSAADVANLLHRAGAQVGIGEGRADSKQSVGMGWGFFKIIN
jgi:hypothetical protein